MNGTKVRLSEGLTCDSQHDGPVLLLQLVGKWSINGTEHIAVLIWLRSDMIFFNGVE